MLRVASDPATAISGGVSVGNGDGSGGVFKDPAMRGRVRICIATAVLDKQVVESLLHPRMRLVSPPGPISWEPGKHPAVLEFSKQIRVKDLLGVEHTYHEMIVNIPGVLIDSPLWRLRSRILAFFGPVSFNYMTVLYLDDTIAVVGGRFFWGFHKLKAKFEVQRDKPSERWRISREDKLICDSTAIEQGPGQKAVDNPHFRDWEPIFNSRTVTRVPLTIFGWKFEFFMTTRYGWELGKAILHPLRMQVHAQGQMECGMPPIDLDAPGIDATPLGAFQTFFPWYLTPAAPFWAPLRWLAALVWRLYFWLRRLLTKG